MSAESQEAISRRDLFARLLGRERSESPAPSTEDARPPESLVEKYLALLDRQREALPFGVAETHLPDAREAIKTAVFDALPPDAHPALREVLRDAYASLAWFVAGDDLDVMRAGKRALEALDQSEGGKQTVVTAFSLRARKLHEMTMLGKEFDER